MPARTLSLSLDDMPAPEVALVGLWTAKATKTQKRQQVKKLHDLDLADDLKTLWTTRWKSACKRQQYPFQDASYLDVAPLMTSLLQRGTTSARSPLFTTAFISLAESLATDARASLTSPGNAERASQLFLRACALLRTARFPYSPSSSRNDAEPCDLKRKAYALQKAYYLESAGLSGLNSPLDEVMIPHVHDLETMPDPGQRGDLGMRAREGEAHKPKRRPQVPAYVRVPLETLLTGQQCPVAMVLTRDRTGETKACEEVLSRGWACAVVEVPGEGECPVTREEGFEAEGRLWRSVLDWMGNMFFFDMERLVVIGETEVSLRMAASHGDRVKGVVSYADEQQSVFEKTPLCRTLIVSGGVETVESSGLWTPPVEKEEGESLMLSAYEAGSTACIGQLETADAGKVYGWIEAVVDSRASEIDEGPVNTPSFESAPPKGKQVALPPWYSMDFTPPNSDVEMASSLGSLY